MSAMPISSSSHNSYVFLNISFGGTFTFAPFFSHAIIASSFPKRLSDDCLGKIMSFLANSDDFKSFPLISKKMNEIYHSERQLNQIRSFLVIDLRNGTLEECKKFKKLLMLKIPAFANITERSFSAIQGLPIISFDCSNVGKSRCSPCQFQRYPMQNMDYYSRNSNMIDDSKILDIHLSYLKNIPSLQYINLRMCCKITDSGIKHFQCLSLRHLNLSYCSNITDLCLYYLEKMPLEYLNLSHCLNITANGLKHLVHLSLTYLNVSDCPLITNIGLGYLEKMPLVFLDLSGSQSRITDVGLTRLDQLPLQQLNLSRCFGITEQAVFHVTQFVHLRFLNLTECSNVRSSYRKQWNEKDLKNWSAIRSESLIEGIFDFNFLKKKNLTKK